MKTDIFIRRAERDDLDTVVAWMERPDFQHFLYGDAARSPRRIREQIVGMLGRSTGQAVPAGIYLILDSKQYGPVGLVSLQGISWRNHACTLDLYIGNEKLRRTSAAAMAAYKALEYCFDEMNLHRVMAFIYAFNRPSWRLFELTGAVREVTLKEQVARDGKLHDIYCYGLLRDEFKVFQQRMLPRLGLHTHCAVPGKA